MVSGQLEVNGVVDPRVLAAMGRVPREVFVPSSFVGSAYRDDNLPLIAGRFLVRPLVLARMLQAAGLREDDRVLDMAPATGYSTVVMARLAKNVIGVEPAAVLQNEAVRNVELYAPDRARILAGAPVEGCLEHAPFDVIVVNGSVDFLPDLFFDQLTEGGRLVAVMRDRASEASVGLGRATLYRKTGGAVSAEVLFDAFVPPAPGFAASRPFVF